MKKETIEQKVERLEFYVNLLREFAVNPEMFVLWDYIIAEGLSEKQTQQILNVLREHHNNIKIAKETGQLCPDIDDLSVKLIPLLSAEGKIASKETVLQIVKRASKLPIFPYLV